MAIDKVAGIGCCLDPELDQILCVVVNAWVDPDVAHSSARGKLSAITRMRAALLPKDEVLARAIHELDRSALVAQNAA